MKLSLNQGIRFVTFDAGRERLSRFITGKRMLVDFMAGGWAGFVSAIISNPIDVVKTNMQGLNASKYNTVGGTFASIYRADGVYGFYKGIGPRLLRVCFEIALTWSIFH